MDHNRPKFLTAEEFARGAEIIRDRQKRFGQVVIQPTLLCACGHKKLVAEMPRIASTGVTEGVVSHVCKGCTKEAGQLACLVCVGCKESVALIKPHKERSGFVWRGGRFYHVVDCPGCKLPAPKKSHVLEMVLHFRREGIPFE
jgi:hypothetical protein